jgi:hypothetical protein
MPGMPCAPPSVFTTQAYLLEAKLCAKAVNLLSNLLIKGILGSVVLAPVVAAIIVVRAPKPRPSAFTNWLGLSIAGELGVALSLYALLIGLMGSGRWPDYRLAYVFAAAMPILAFMAAREHLRRLGGRATEARGLGAAYLGLAALVVTALAPWLLGAPLPIDGAQSGLGLGHAGAVRDYAWVVLPIAVAVVAEAWLLMRRPTTVAQEGTPGAAGGRCDAFAWLASIGVAILLLGVMLLLPGSRWNARRAAKLEHAVLREEAERLDAPRRLALAEIVAGRAPRLLAEPCPAGATPESWQAWKRFASAPKDWESLRGQAETWQKQTVANVWQAGLDANIALRGPRRQAIFALPEDEPPYSPWFARELLFPREGDSLGLALSPSEPWNADATLAISVENLSYALSGETSLGSLRGILWVWSYRQQAFVCGGEARVLGSELAGGFTDQQAPTVKASIRMRALAYALSTLRAVERTQ